MTAQTPGDANTVNLADPAAAISNGGLVDLGGLDIAVAESTTGRAIGPLRLRRSLDDASSSLRLAIKPGDQIDPDWIVRQFQANELLSGPVAIDRVTSIVRLINQLIASEGYINSGLLIESQELPAPGQKLKLRFILGRASAIDGTPAPTVVWKEKRKRGLSTDFITARLPAASEEPFDAKALERQFRLLAEDPAIRTINADLRAMPESGLASLSLSVDPADRFDLYGLVANNRSPTVGGVRFAVGGSARNLLVPGAFVSGELGRTQGLSDSTLAADIPFLAPRVHLTLRGGYNQASVVDLPLRPLDIRSEDWSAEGGLSVRLFERPLLPAAPPDRPTSARTITTSLLVSHRESRTSLLGEPFSFSPGANAGLAKYTALRLGLDWVERSANQVIVASIITSMGLNGSRSDTPGVPSPHQNFKVALAQVNFAHRLTRHNLELRTRLLGQISDGILYSLERLSAGGQDTVRGYRENVLLADKGAIASVEIAQPFSLASGKMREASFNPGAFAISAFFDAAVVQNHGELQPEKKWLASVGASFSWTPSPSLTARITYGKTLNALTRPSARDLQDHGVQFLVVFHPLALLRR